MTRVAAGNPFALHDGAAETWAFIERNVLESDVVDHALKELCFAYLARPDDFEPGAHEDPERAALEWTHAIAWDADAATDELWDRLHRHFSEPQLVDLGCAIGFELGRQHFLRALSADPAAVRAAELP